MYLDQNIQIIYKGSDIKLSPDLFTATLYDRRQWSNICKTLKARKCEPRVLYPCKLTFKYKEHIETVVNIQDVQNLRHVLAHVRIQTPS